MTKTRAEQAEGQQRQAAGRLMMCQEACEAEAVARKAADDQVGLLKAEAKVAQDKFMGECALCVGRDVVRAGGVLCRVLSGLL